VIKISVVKSLVCQRSERFFLALFRAMRILFLLLIVVCSTYQVEAQGPMRRAMKHLLLKETSANTYEFRDFVSVSEKQENVRLVAIGLDVFLGIFAVHRMYLGTDVKVPIFYTLTAGGACVLWLVDLGLLIGAEDIESFKNNPHIFMWNVEKDK
jgi:TM2 domain-containing membrane protein YozV